MLFTKAQEYKASIEGMKCMHCSEKVEKTIKALKGVKKVSVSLENKEASIYAKVKDEKAFFETIKEKIKEAGFEVSDVK